MHRTPLVPLRILVPGLALVFVSCGGGGGGGATSSAPQPLTTAYATTLSYTNPTATGYSLQADPASNNTGHLALNLVGPAGAVAQGVSIFLTADPAMVAWSLGAGSAYATPGSVFNLGTAPQAFIAQASATGMLQVGLYQKSGAATLTTGPLVTVALDLKAGAVVSGSAVALAATPGQQAVYVDGNSTVQPLPAIAIGQLVAR